MSHELYDPFESEIQSSTEGQYELRGQHIESNFWRVPPHLGPESSFSSSGPPSAIPDNTRGIFSSPMSQLMNHGPDQRRAIMEENRERNNEMHISRAREEVKSLGKPMHQSIDDGTGCTGLQRNEFCSSSTRMASHPMSSASSSLGHRPSDVERGRSSWDWLLNYKKPTADDSKLYSSSKQDLQSIPGLGDEDCRVPKKLEAPTESGQPKYTSESAVNIIQNFGLEKEDLEHLISYPDDQMTRENMPYILRQIRIQKAKRATTAGQSKPYPVPQSTRSLCGMDSHTLSTSGGSGMRLEEITSAVLQPSKVIDYGHTGRYTGGAGNEIGRTSGSKANSDGGGNMLLMDTCDTSKNSRGPLQKYTTEVKSSALGSSLHQASTVVSLSSSNSSALSFGATPSQQLQTPPSQPLETLLKLFSVPKKDTDLRVVRSEASKPVTLKESTSDHQSVLKNQPPTNLLHGVDPGRSGRVLIGSNDSGNSGTKDQRKTQSHGSTEQMKKQQSHDQMKKQQSRQQMQKQQVDKQSKQKKQLVSLAGQVMWPPVFSEAKSDPPVAGVHGITDATRAMQYPVFIPAGPRHIVIPPVLPQPISAQMSFNHAAMPTSHWQPPANVAVFKGLPTLAMMQDYAAASPRIFPHTCSLCYKDCTQMKDWISHQNTNLHLESCTRLRKQYPDWDGEIAVAPRAAGAKLSTSTSASNSQHRRPRTRHGSHSRSHSDSHSRSSSPPHHHALAVRREKRSSRSRSPQSSRHTRRSRSRSRSHSPWYDDLTSFHYQSRSRSSERRSSPKRKDERRSSPRRYDKRRLPPRRVDERRSPPRRRDERHSPPWRIEERQLPARGSRESQSSREGSTPQQKKSSSAKILAKKLLKKSAVRSLSTQSDLETMVKTLAPALLAELAKMKSSSSSSSSTAKKKSTAKPSKAKPGLKKSKASSATKTKSTVSTMRPPKKKRVGAVTSAFNSRKVLLPTPNIPTFYGSPRPSPSGAQTATTWKPTIQKIPTVGSVKARTAVINSQILGLKAKKILTKRISQTAKARQFTNLVTVFEPNHLAKHDKANDAEDTEHIQLGEMAAEPMEVGSGSHGEGEKPSTTGAIPENSVDKPCGTQPTTSETLSTETKTKQNDPVTAVKTQMDAAPASLTIGEMLEKTSTTGAVPEKSVDKPCGTQPTTNETLSTEPKTKQNDPVTAVKTQMDAAPASLTIGEMLEKHLFLQMIPSFSLSFPPNFYRLQDQEFLISRLPEYNDGCYTEDDLAKLLMPLGFKYEYDKIYVVPQKRLAFVKMSTEVVERDVPDANKKKVFFKGFRLSFHVLSQGFEMKPLGFYKSLMELMKSPLVDGGPRTIFINNISPGDIRNLREALKEMYSLRNYLPLLNKVFIEFESVEDADRFQVWYSPVQQEFGHEVHRLKTPDSRCTLPYPETTTKSETDASSAKVESVTTEPKAAAVSEKQPAVTAVTPLTIGQMVEKHLDPRRIECLDWKNYHDRKSFMNDKKLLLITGLPKYHNGYYTEDNITKLLIPLGFQRKTDNIYVVPQSCVAFIQMPTAEAVHKIMEVKGKNGMFFKGSKLHFRVVSSFSAETPLGFYKSLMELMQSPVVDDGDKVVVINKILDKEAKQVRKTLKNAGSVRNYLPLLNKVFIEFESVEDADRFQVWYSPVQQEFGHEVHRLKTPDSSCTLTYPETTTTSETDAASAKVESVTNEPKAAAVSEKQPAATAVTPLTIGEMVEKHLDPRRIECLDWKNYHDRKTLMNDKKLLLITGLPKYHDGYYTEDNITKLLIPLGFQRKTDNIFVVPQSCVAFVQMPTAEAVHKIMEVKGKNGMFFKGSKIHFRVVSSFSAETALGFYKSLMELMQSPVVDNGEKVVVINNISKSEAEDIRKTLKNFGSVRNYLPLLNKVFIEFESIHDADRFGVWYRLLKPPCRHQVIRLKIPNSHNTAPLPRDSSVTAKSADAAVTPQIIGKMVEKHIPQNREVCLNWKNCAPAKGQVDFTDDGLPDACLFDEKKSFLYDSVTDKFDGDMRVLSPEPHRSSSSSRTRIERQPAGEQISASVSEPSSSSSPLSTETPQRSQKTQQSKTKSTTKASNTTSSAVEASIETHLEPLGEEAKATEGAVAKSDHKVSGEGSAAKTVESETKVETSSEMHPSSQGHGEELSQTQSLEVNVDVNTPKEQRKSQEDENEDDEDDFENYLILDSLDDQTDEQMDDGDRGCSSESNPAVPVEDQTLHEQSYQVLDSVNDEGRACQEDDDEMEMDGSFQVLDSVTEDQAATGQEDSHLVQDDGATVKGLSEEDAGPVVDKSRVKDAVGKDEETNDKDHFQGLDTDSKQAQREKEHGKNRNQREVLEDVGNSHGQLGNEDCDNKDNFEYADIDIDPETFEILDSIDDQTATEDDSQKLETGIDQMSKEDIGPIEQEEDTFQVIDSLEDQPTTTENQPETDNKEKRTRKGEAAARKDGPSRRSGRTNTASKTEEKEKSPKKQDRAVKKYETRTKLDTAGVPEKDKEATEEMMYEIVDSVEDEPVQDAATPERSSRRRSARGKTEDRTSSEPTEVSERPVRDEEATYEILDSVEEEIAEEEPAVTTRSTRGRRERTSKKDASHEKTNKEETPTRRRHSPAGQSQERREETPKKEEKASPTKKSGLKEASEDDGTCEILDSVEDEVGKDDQPARGRKGRRGRPKKEVKTAEKVNVALKKGDRDASEKVAEEEEATYQILDSVEEDTTDDQPPPGHSESSSKGYLSASTRNEEEEEPMYQIVDSVEDDEEEQSDRERKENDDEAKEGESAGLFELVEDSAEAKDDLPVSEESGSRNEKSSDIKKEDKSPSRSQSDTEIPETENEQKSAEKNYTTSTLDNLDEVSEDEEDYPDDTAEEEELRKRQDATREKQITKERETRRTRERGRENEEIDAKDLVTLDEVGSDEAAEERPPESREREREFSEGELQTFVTLDEFIEEEEEEEEEEDIKVEQSTLETPPLLQEAESVDSFNPETLVTLDEAGGDEEEQAEKTSRSAERDDDTEEIRNFVTVDEVGEVEEKEAVTTRTSGRAKKRTRPTPARKSDRGKKVSEKDPSKEKEPTDEPLTTSLGPSSSLDPSTLSSDVPKKAEKQTLEECVEDRKSRADIKAVSKGRTELVRLEAKRARFQSPRVSADFKPPAIKPNNPRGKEFVVPKSGYFCNLCSVFYLTESTAKDAHCSSRRHYDNLKKHYQKLEQERQMARNTSLSGSSVCD